MVHHIGARRGFLWSGRMATLLNTVIVAVICAATGLAIWFNHEAAFEQHQRGMTSMGGVLAEQTARYVQVIDLIVQEVQTHTEAMEIEGVADLASRLEGPEIKAYLAERVRNVPQANAIVLIGRDGTTLNSSRERAVPAVNLANRDYFRYFQTHNDPGLFIGSPSIGQVTGRLNLFFARRISGSDGRFLGLVLGVVDIRYLGELYHTASEHLGEAVTLLRHDGTMLMRYPNPEAAIGVKLPTSSAWYDRVARGGGIYLTAGVLDGIPGVVSVHPLHDYPLVVNVLLQKAIVFAEWRTQTVYMIAFALLATLASTALFIVLARDFRHQVVQNAKLRESAMRLSENQQMLRSYAEMSSDWFWEQDTDFRFTTESTIPFMNARNITGKTRRELADSAMREERWTAHEADLAARQPFRDFRWDRIGSDGALRFISTSGDPVFDRHGVFAGYRGTGRDITAEVRANARLAEANRELRLGSQQIAAVLGNITHGVCLFDGAHRLVVWNRRYVEIYNLPPEAAQFGCSLQDTFRYRDLTGTAADMSPAEHQAWLVRLGAATQPSSRVVTLKNGRVVMIHHQPMAGGGFVATHEDITERQKAEASLAFMAQHDALTRLANRALFNDRLAQAIALLGRGTQFALLCLDLDHFKMVNDTLGHPIGDGLLQGVADRLRACVREGDTVARLGGDEFAIIQTGVADTGDAEILGARIVEAFRAPFDVMGHQIPAGISVGATVAPDDGASAEKLLRNADIALYSAKTDGRGTVRFFEPEMDARIIKRRAMERDLQDAIVRDEFEIYYQPLINLAAGTITGFEALLRWHHPTRGMVPPDEFIPVAEETGLIVEIGAGVLRKACFEAENWPADIKVAVNLSPVQFRKPNLSATVEQALTASGLRPERLELEITESVLLHDSAGTLTALHEFRAMGVAIALDDFGTGYSSLSYLRSFPFDKIKIDKSFVRDLMTNKESMSIVRAVAGLGQSLNIKILAEGVETLEQLEALKQEGCTEVQGYLFSRPMPAGEVPGLIERLRCIDQFLYSKTPII